MKTTMLSRPIANPRRTRLALLADAEAPAGAPHEEHEEDAPPPLPRQTANPRRTVLDKPPAG